MQIEAMTLDEADEMLKMGFQDDVERIFDAAPKERQVAPQDTRPSTRVPRKVV